jgi:hypothetical protein
MVIGLFAMSTLPASTSISASFAQCIQAFRELLLLLQDKECRVTRLEQVDLQSVVEEFGRLKIWGDQSKADLPSGSRGSLDDTLRHDAELRDLVRGILLRLRDLIDEGKSRYCLHSVRVSLLTTCQRYRSRNACLILLKALIKTQSAA